jgi:hypothetical protein
MRRVLTVFGIIAILYGSEAVGVAQQKAAKEQPQAKVSSMTGCVDEQEGHYVLVDDHNLKAIASLEADGFPKESFAKHVGHKVTVRGTSNAGGTVPLFKVRSVETVSDICAPDKAR